MPKTPFSWRCPFCNHDVTITDSNHREEKAWSYVKATVSEHVAICYFTVCPNPRCKKLSFAVGLHEAYTDPHRETGRVVKEWQLIPASQAKVFPDYIPKPILDDYEEACLTRDLSPKASATMARRCLQGMIRNFWEVQKNNLKAEIEAIEDRVDPLTWEAIEAVRKVGNVGAHMEKDIDLIIDVEPEEAGRLIWLIELLLHDWYIVRHERQESLNAIAGLAANKESKRK